jgi:acyl-CoA thioesterase FadM
VVYPKGFAKDGSGKLFLYAYGAYGYAVPPAFNTNRISLLDRGWAYAIAHIRGGDDLGYQWFLDGKLAKRTNTFNDFVDVAKGLVAQGFTAKGRIAINGGSAGGELMGAVVNSDPDLWGAVVADVPFVDVLNTMLDDTLPLTPGEWPEWGNPITDEAAFHLLRSYSPYDNVKTQGYPPMLITGGLNDPRVTYWEPAKWAAKLRVTKTDENLLLLKINMGAGHGGKSGRWERLRADAGRMNRPTFELAFTALPEHIDELGHVNNAVWVQWIQHIAVAHWHSVADPAHDEAYFWVVTRHEIDYLRAAFEGDRVVGKTWVGDAPKGARFDRHVEFTGNDGRTCVRARTSWAIIDRASSRPIRVPPEVIAPFMEARQS